MPPLIAFRCSARSPRENIAGLPANNIGTLPTPADRSPGFSLRVTTDSINGWRDVASVVRPGRLPLAEVLGPGCRTLAALIWRRQGHLVKEPTILENVAGEVILRVTRHPPFRSVTGSSLVAVIRYLRT